MFTKDNKTEIKTAGSSTLIKLTDYYESNCSAEEYAEVSVEVLEFLQESRREDKKYEMRDYRHRTPFNYDEIKTSELGGAVTESAEDTLLRNYDAQDLYQAMDKLPPSARRRFYLYYAVGMTMERIAELEGVSHVAVVKSLRSSAKALQKTLCDNA